MEYELETQRPDRMIKLEHPPITEIALLVRIATPEEDRTEVEESIEEMRQLAWTAGADVRQVFIQRRDKPCPATAVGKGKVEDIKAAVEGFEANVVMFDSELTPAQGSKLENLLDVKVVDRTQLILDIFAQRAQTNEGKHQVELAQLQYILPRLSGRGSIMRQQGGIGVRGPGETKLETDRRVIRIRIQRLRAELDEIRKHRRVQRKRRSEGAVGTVALVGYTNAGKSSLLNALSGADVLVEDKLFATLDPRARRCPMPNKREAVFTDTVGFIRRLPHSLVAAFRATLEEVNDADLLLLVVDSAHPAAADHIRTVHEVLKEIEANEKPMLLVLNKNDIADPVSLSQIEAEFGSCVRVSAHTGAGLDTLLEQVAAKLGESRRVMTLRIPQRDARLAARLHQAGGVLKEEYDGNDILITAEIEPETFAEVEAYRVQDTE